jgi:hypothetical protein
MLDFMWSGGVRIALAIALALGTLLGTSFPALAKGSTSAVIRGPGLSSPITVTHADELDSLDESSGLTTGLWRGSCQTYHGCVRHPTGDLGSPYTVTYTLFPHGTVVQFIYPDASAGPTAYVPAGQRLMGGQSTVGGWFVAGRTLSQLLLDLGVPSPGPLVSAGPEAPTAAGKSWLPALTLAIVILVLISLAAAWRRASGKPEKLRSV